MDAEYSFKKWDQGSTIARGVGGGHQEGSTWLPVDPWANPPAPLVSLESTPHPSLPHLEPFSRMQARESSVLLRPPAQSSGLNTEKAALETWRMLAAGSET